MRVRQAVIAAALGVVISTQLFLFTPFTLYTGNAGQFTVSFAAAIGVWSPLAVLLTGGVGLACFLLPDRYRAIYLSVVATASILIWTQGNLLVWNYGPLDGRDIDWNDVAWRGWLEFIVWSGALVAAGTGYRLLGPLILRLATALFLLQFALFTYHWLQYGPSLFERTEIDGSTAFNKILRFSEKKNVVHIIADGFQSDIFAELLEEESGRQIKDALSGFIFFRDNMGVFPYTHMTIPAILSGVIYRNNVPIGQHMADTVGGKSILSVANDAGYEIDLAVPAGGPAKIYRNSRHTNLYLASGRAHISDSEFEYQDAAKLLDLSLFRVSPHFIKKFIYNDQLWRIQLLFADQAHMNLDFFSHVLFLKELSEKMTADRPAPVYKLIHLMLSHRPMVTTARCRYAGRLLPMVRETVKRQSRCALVEIVQFLENMKRLGIYDDATIVLMGDHGAWIPPLGVKGIVNPDGKSVEVIHLETLALSVPLLAFKRPGDSGPLNVSDAPSWIIDTAATIADVEGLKADFAGKSVFKLTEDETRERQFYYYQYKRSEWTDDYLAPIEEYAINGPVVDSSSWRYTRTHLSGGQTERTQSENSLWMTLPLR